MRFRRSNIEITAEDASYLATVSIFNITVEHHDWKFLYKESVNSWVVRRRYKREISTWIDRYNKKYGRSINMYNFIYTLFDPNKLNPRDRFHTQPLKISIFEKMLDIRAALKQSTIFQVMET